ncbi:MAG: hypothetical protein QXU82_01200 [Candidatus Aenigmatarchaeota archaeon]
MEKKGAFKGASLVRRTPIFISHRRIVELDCEELRIRGKTKEFIKDFFTVLMQIVEKKELPEVPDYVVRLVSIYQASKLMGKKINMDNLIKKFNIIVPKILLEFNQIYEDIVGFQSVEEVEHEYKKIMDEYEEKVRGLNKRDKAIG